MRSETICKREMESTCCMKVKPLSEIFVGGLNFGSVFVAYSRFFDWFVQVFSVKRIVLSFLTRFALLTFAKWSIDDVSRTESDFICHGWLHLLDVFTLLKCFGWLSTSFESQSFQCLSFLRPKQNTWNRLVWASTSKRKVLPWRSASVVSYPRRHCRVSKPAYSSWSLAKESNVGRTSEDTTTKCVCAHIPIASEIVLNFRSAILSSFSFGKNTSSK